MPKMNNRLVAMCSVAVGILYSGAYAVTSSQAAPIQSTVTTSIQKIPTGNNGSNNTDTNNGSTSNRNGSTDSTPSPSSATTTPAQTTPQYKDGTYTGSGSDRRGSVEVAVTIAKGKISNVEITQYNMRYSESNIDPVLLQEVVQFQSSSVDIVSGATSSSEDFQVAVEQALSQAQV